MCGRYASFTPPSAIRALMRAVNSVPNMAPSWNVAPSQQAMVVRRHSAWITKPTTALGPVEIHRELMTAVAR
jgi:putative SOS response-associated peptidase YedK